MRSLAFVVVGFPSPQSHTKLFAVSVVLTFVTVAVSVVGTVAPTVAGEAASATVKLAAGGGGPATT